MPIIAPFVMLNGRIEEAASFYAAIFNNSRIESASPMSAVVELDGQRLMLFNGGDHFKLSEACSFFVSCKDQSEVDHYWTRLLADGGAEGQCGWLKDKFGLSWQVIPAVLGEYLADPDRARADRVMQAMLAMRRINVAALNAAHADPPGARS